MKILLHIKDNLKETVIEEILEIDFNKFNIDIPRIFRLSVTVTMSTHGTDTSIKIVLSNNNRVKDSLKRCS